MADEVVSKTGPFDVETVASLVRLMAEHDLSEIDLRDGHQRIRLRKGSLVSAAAPVVVSQPVPMTTTSASGGSAPPPSLPTKQLIEIRSKMVGTFYSKPKPDKDEYVKVGSRVSPDTLVCQIEAMKLFNEIAAECSGVIAEVLVQNQQFVEFDQVIFRVDPSA